MPEGRGASVTVPIGYGQPPGPALSWKQNKPSMSKSTRNTGKHWTSADTKQLKSLARENTPTRVIGLKLGRTEEAVRSKAAEKRVSLKPTNQSPYNRSSN